MLSSYFGSHESLQFSDVQLLFGKKVKLNVVQSRKIELIKLNYCVY